MARPKPEPLEPRPCRREVCKKIFVPKYVGQEYCCKKCSDSDTAAYRMSSQAKPVYHGGEFTFSQDMITCLVADDMRDRVIRTAQAYGIPLELCQQEIARLKETGEYAVVADRIKNRWGDPDKAEHHGINVSGHILRGAHNYKKSGGNL